MQDVVHIAKKRKRRKKPDYTPKVYTKDDLIKAIENKNSMMANRIITKIDKNLLDDKVLQVALKYKNSSIIKNVVDYTSHKDLAFNYKNELQQIILKSNDIENLVGQMLSHKDNESFDREMQGLVYDVYLDTIKKHYNKGNINNNFNLNNFQDSMNLSQKFLYNPKSINLDNVDKNKFLLLPVYSEGHAFSALAKKINDDKYSITFVNLGARPHENFSEDNKYKEFIYTKKDAEHILKQFSINARTDYPHKVVNVERAYKTFAKKSIEEYTLHVDSHNQKVGNCFTKNIEKGIRFAVSIELSKAEYNDFNSNQLRKQINKPYKVKFLKPLFKNIDKNINNKELSTISLRKDLIDSIIKKFPQYNMIIKQEWNRYDRRKAQKMDIDM